MLECPALGALKRMRIGHDNAGSSPGWYLNKVIVDDLDAARVFEFPCARWFAKDEDDGQISRELTCSGGPGDAPPGMEGNYCSSVFYQFDGYLFTVELNYYILTQINSRIVRQVYNVCQKWFKSFKNCKKWTRVNVKYRL